MSPPRTCMPPRAHWRRPPAPGSIASRKAPTPSAWPRSACCRSGQGRNADAMLADAAAQPICCSASSRNSISRQAAQADRRLPAPRSWRSPRSHPKQLKKVADVILPIGLLPEIEATLTNLDGTDQTSARRRQVAGRGARGLARAARPGRRRWRCPASISPISPGCVRRVKQAGMVVRRRPAPASSRRPPGSSASPPRRSIAAMPCCVARRRCKRIR